MKQVQEDPWGNPFLDKFSEMCLKALQKVETIKMKTNVLGLNISLDDFDLLYSNMRRSFTKDYERIESTIKELANTMVSSLRLTHIHCMRACNSIVLEIRRKYRTEHMEQKINVVPYGKFEADKRLIEERFLSYRKMNLTEKKKNLKEFYEEVEGLLNTFKKEEAEKYEGFENRPNDYYLLHSQPKLAWVYWDLMNKFRVDLQQVSDVLYRTNTNVLSEYTTSILHFNKGVANTRNNLLTKLIVTPTNELGVHKYVKIQDTAQHKPQEFTPKSSVLRNKFKGKEKVVSFSSHYYIEKDICRNTQERLVEREREVKLTNYSIDAHPCPFESYGVWEKMIDEGFSNIDEQLLVNFRALEEQFEQTLKADKIKFQQTQVEEKSLSQLRKPNKKPTKKDEENIKLYMEMIDKVGHSITTSPSQAQLKMAFLNDPRQSRTEMHRRVVEVSDDDEEEDPNNKSHNVKKHKKLLRERSENGNVVEEQNDDDFSDLIREPSVANQPILNNEHSKEQQPIAQSSSGSDSPKRMAAQSNSTPTIDPQPQPLPSRPVPENQKASENWSEVKNSTERRETAQEVENNTSKIPPYPNQYEQSFTFKSSNIDSRMNQTIRERPGGTIKERPGGTIKGSSRINTPKITEINRDTLSQPAGNSPFGSSTLTAPQSPTISQPLPPTTILQPPPQPVPQQPLKSLPQPPVSNQTIRVSPSQPSIKEAKVQQPQSQDKMQWQLENKSVTQPAPAPPATSVQTPTPPPTKPKSLFASNKGKQPTIKREQPAVKIQVPFKSHDVSARPKSTIFISHRVEMKQPPPEVPKPKPKEEESNEPLSLEMIMKKVALTPSGLYNLYCSYFKLPGDPPSVSAVAIYRYGMKVPTNLQKVLAPEYREFMWMFLREKYFLNDLPDDDRYIYKGPQVIFSKKTGSPKASLEQAKKELDSFKLIIILDQGLFLLHRKNLTRQIKMLKFLHCYFSFDTEFEKRHKNYEAAFEQVFQKQACIKKKAVVRLQPDVTQLQQRQYYIGMLCHFMNGGNFDEDEISEFKPAMKYESIVKDFEVLLKNGYMYPSRASSENAEIIDPNYKPSERSDEHSDYYDDDSSDH